MLTPELLSFLKIFSRKAMTATWNEICAEAGVSDEYGRLCMKRPDFTALLMDFQQIEHGKIATKADRLIFWSRMMFDKRNPGNVRLKASELLGKAAGDFDVELIRRRAKEVTDKQLREYIRLKIGGAYRESRERDLELAKIHSHNTPIPMEDLTSTDENGKFLTTGEGLLAEPVILTTKEATEEVVQAALREDSEDSALEATSEDEDDRIFTKIATVEETNMIDDHDGD
jgi:hypothetical protein